MILDCYVETIETCDDPSKAEGCDGHCCGNGNVKSEERKNTTTNIDWLSWIRDWKEEMHSEYSTTLVVNWNRQDAWATLTVVDKRGNGSAQIKFTRAADPKQLEAFALWAVNKKVTDTATINLA